MKSKRLILVVIAAMALMLATVSVASALTLVTPGGHEVEGLPNAVTSAGNRAT